MNLCVRVILLCVVITFAASDQDQRNSSAYDLGSFDIQRFGLELLLAKLDNIQQTLLEQHQSTRKEIFTALHRLEHAIGHNLTELQERSLMQTTCVTPKPKHPIYSSCKDVPSNVSGVYLIRLNSKRDPIKVFCEQEKFGGGWIVVQHRFDGSVDFYRNWTEYRDGFGDLDKEHWLGLEKMHLISKARAHELIVELKDFSGTYKYARYNAFEVGNESEQYSLKTLGTYSGTAGDSMAGNAGMKFKTMDSTRDRNTVNCAEHHASAWWYNYCTFANLNGRYSRFNNDKSMFWYHFKGNHEGLCFSRMMIRQLN
ncbi:fibrinogen-like protein A [Anopheles aquasalis]|uniref:fibrinogen-like protein A n=1 Tax=Anopheles aquasalis TaxID=42839 RepID=UPI00215A90DB|nr:fibrinogen-like protein A [Anopheles aquasalis]